MFKNIIMTHINILKTQIQKIATFLIVNKCKSKLTSYLMF